jgi:hypothetical protein
MPAPRASKKWSRTSPIHRPHKRIPLRVARVIPAGVGASPTSKSRQCSGTTNHDGDDLTDERVPSPGNAVAQQRSERPSKFPERRGWPDLSPSPIPPVVGSVAPPGKLELRRKRVDNFFLQNRGSKSMACGRWVRLQTWPFDEVRPDLTREPADQPAPHSVGYCKPSQIEKCRFDWLEKGAPAFFWKRLDQLTRAEQELFRA